MVKKKQKTAAVATCFVVEFLFPSESPFNSNFGNLGCLVILNTFCLGCEVKNSNGVLIVLNA